MYLLENGNMEPIQNDSKWPYRNFTVVWNRMMTADKDTIWLTVLSSSISV